MWRVIDRFPFYMVNEEGQIWSTLRNRVLKPGLSAGYLFVSLRGADGKGHSVKVHSLVAAAFLGEAPPGKEANHKNGNREDCRADNLEYITHAENIQHSVDVLGKRKPWRSFCKQGHALVEGNVTNDGHRRCLICRKLANREYKRARRSGAGA